jgi:interferon gamma-inducible protein 30
MFKTALLTAAVASGALAKGADYPLVPVVLDYEALCPGCQTFTTGTLKDVLAKPDMAEIIALKLVPYGNTKQNADGSFTCQHGEGECQSDALELCVQYKLSGDINSIETGDTSMAAWPFILCMEEEEGDFSKGEACFSSSMNSTALSWNTVQSCYNDEYDLVMNAGMKATDPDHSYVPWVVVDNTLLEHQGLLQKAVCDAYTGPTPASCEHFEASTSAEVKKCNK